MTAQPHPLPANPMIALAAAEQLKNGNGVHPLSASLPAKPGSAPPERRDPPAPAPEPTATVPMPELPAEVMQRIFRNLGHGLSASTRYTNLLSACLVKKSWLAPAQEILCRDVVIESQTTATKWLESPASERHVAVSIEIDGRYGQVDAFATESVLYRAKLGIKRLRIDFVRGLSSRAFCLPNLASITDLTLHCKVLCDATPIFIHFHLSRLVLGGSYFPLAFSKALLAASVESLNELTMTMQQAHSPTLREDLNREIGTLVNLRVFSDWCRTSQEFIDLCPFLPASLETVNTCWPDRHRLTSFVRAFDLASFPRLTDLRWTYLTPEEVAGTADGAKLLSMCAQREINVAYGFEKDYLREEHLLSRTEALRIYY
ncbi:hypothetical protein T439DRAFT_324710 [Meredithblackwellia eburnea MCA 4105]